MIKIPTSATMNVTVRIHQRYLLACSAFSDQESVKDIGWYRCTTNDCEHEWDKHRIAHVQNMRETISDNPNFEVYTNGTLVIKRVLPVDDGKVFICIANRKYVGKKQSNTNLSVAKEAPQLQLESPKRLHIIEGMDLHLDARVQGYPFPRVTWIHGENLLKSTPNVDSETSLKIRNVTASESGNYTCLAENLFGRVFFTVNVYVKGQPGTTTTEPDIQPSSSPSPSGGSSFTGWKIAVVTVCVLLVVIVILYIVKKKCRPKLRLKRFFRRYISSEQ
ncbi:immunoglobulin superfamily member 10-like isoform X2 [Stylophora pistillata]|nr:immunoglobulin superfamily member 10-like isoform X2 [Stylophora pistillata]